MQLCQLDGARILMHNQPKFIDKSAPIDELKVVQHIYVRAHTHITHITNIPIDVLRT